MPFPNPPSIDIPRWAYSGGIFLEPSLLQRQTGWTVIPGQNVGQIPPYQWVNWLDYSTGEWINYIATQWIPYAQTQAFSSGVLLTTTTQTITTNNNLIFTTPTYFNFSGTAWTTDTFTAQITGVHEISFSVQNLNTPVFNNNNEYSISVNKNGSTLLFYYQHAQWAVSPATDLTCDSFTIKEILNSGDTITFNFVSSSLTYQYGTISQICISWGF
jgi:hypothetical protein